MNNHDLLHAIVNRDPRVKNMVSRYLSRRCGSHERAPAFCDLAESMDEQQFWTVFHNEWTGFDAIDHFIMEQLIGNNAHAWRAEYMNEEDRAFYDSLPDTITIYRGQGSQSYPGLSWTTDYTVAESFALGHRGHNRPDPIVIVATVSKSDIAGAYANREESEIVLFTPDYVEIVERKQLQQRATKDASFLTTSRIY